MAVITRRVLRLLAGGFGLLLFETVALHPVPTATVAIPQLAAIESRVASSPIESRTASCVQTLLAMDAGSVNTHRVTGAPAALSARIDWCRQREQAM